MRLYLDDVRTPVDSEWKVVRSYDEFVKTVTEVGISNIEIISLDHDLGPEAMNEYFNNVVPNYTFNYYSTQFEKTGYDCAKWLVNHFYEINPEFGQTHRLIRGGKIPFPKVYVHSVNPIGAANITGYINNFLHIEGQQQTCVRVQIEHIT